jgi:hypothetical protein
MDQVNSGGRLQFTGMRLFAIIWSGQFFSLLGIYMSQFTLSIWAWQRTGEATALALVALFNFARAHKRFLAINDCVCGIRLRLNSNPYWSIHKFKK